MIINGVCHSRGGKGRIKIDQVVALLSDVPCPFGFFQAKSLGRFDLIWAGINKLESSNLSLNWALESIQDLCLAQHVTSSVPFQSKDKGFTDLAVQLDIIQLLAETEVDNRNVRTKSTLALELAVDKGVNQLKIDPRDDPYIALQCGVKLKIQPGWPFMDDLGFSISIWLCAPSIGWGGRISAGPLNGCTDG